MNKALVIFSGGQDSTTCLLWARQKFPQVEAIFFNYGQRHKIEMECSVNICAKLGIPLKVVTLSFFGDITTGALLNTTESVSVKNKQNLPNSFVPNRNAIFITLAHAYAQKIGAENLVTGVCQTDYSGYPDCRRKFILQMEKALNDGAVGDLADGRVYILTPLMDMSKKETWQLANSCGMIDSKTTAVDFIVKESHTCYEGNRINFHEWGFGCGECPACKLREKGFNEFKNSL